ncbi:hypothetical protein EUGRSUZ_A01513 [Eucalyptus grandis]|uniref:Uncharacterized protein n=2 Tax=Eucalyptus grandis TaxID=71139 RepID=A0A059DF45_EUCGR|nr:hypothetical protein EUGRSUZ_A01513 [Eucalyptus grandis]
MRAPLRPRLALLALMAAAFAGACFDRAGAAAAYHRPGQRPAVFIRDSDDEGSASPQQVRRNATRPSTFGAVCRYSSFFLPFLRVALSLSLSLFLGCCVRVVIFSASLGCRLCLISGGD